MVSYLFRLGDTLIRDDDGATAVEYCVMLTVIILALVGIFATGDVQRLLFEDNSDKIGDALNP
ncbi:MAG TPA: hypothetical protein PKD54_07660 [Pirellulaceae bacterium]|nr:hypothetical protein [Pirellulaceae bacterium]